MAEGMIDRDALNRYVSRVLDLHEQRAALNADISEVYKEAKSAGFVIGIVRQIVREQQMESDEREAHYNLLDSYRHALGMLADTPLGAAAMEQVEQQRMQPPKPFAEQPVRRGRPRKNGSATSVDEAMARAREHLGGDAAGTA